MSNVELKHLCNFRRFPNNVLPVLLYLPVGIALVILRLFILLSILLICSLVPNTQAFHGILLKLLTVTFGISVNAENLDKKEDVDAYISNQISIFDQLVLHSLTQSIMPSSTADPISTIFGVKYFGTKTNIESFKTNVALYLNNNNIPIHLQPESATTNGKAMLKFNTWPFTICSKVQPVVLQIQRPLIDICINTVDSTYWSDAIYFMFSPFTIYNVHFLPCIEKKNLLEVEFAQHVQRTLATALKIEVTEFTSVDLLEWSKTYRSNQQNRIVRQRQPSHDQQSEMQRMILQVQDVLPTVSRSDVIKQLTKSRNVDIVITNLLEEIALNADKHVPAGPSTSTSEDLKPQPDTNNCNFLNTAALSFAKSAMERNVSFQERKRILLDSARRRYIEKHSLNIC